MFNHTDDEYLTDTKSIRLATAEMIVYRAFSRPYSAPGTRVLHLFASGEYSLAPLRFFFRPVPWQSDTFALVERLPNSVSIVRNYVSATYSSRYGASDLPDAVTIIDAHGTNIVEVEPLSAVGGRRETASRDPRPESTGVRRIAHASGTAAVRLLPAPGRGAAAAARALSGRGRTRALPRPGC